MIFKQELSPQNGRYTPLLYFQLGFRDLAFAFPFSKKAVLSSALDL